MKAVSSLLPSYGFSAEQMDTETNIAAWREATSTFFDVDELAAGEAAPFRADVLSYALGSVLLGSARASGQRFRRSAETIARSGVDHIVVQLYVTGGYDGVAGDRPIRVAAGDLCVLDLAQTLETRASAFENVTMVVPRPMFDARLLQVEDLHGLVLPRDGAMAPLLARHFGALLDCAPRLSFDECQAVVDGTISLISACLRGELERRDADRSVSADASLLRIRQYIESQLGSPELSADAVALHFGLSRASLYRLFAPIGGIADYIRSRRLHRAFFDLAGTGSRQVRISEVARRWQLGTDAHFTRLFKTAYGITPSAAREAALLGLPQLPAGGDAEPASPLSRWMRGIAAPRTGE
ncbi:putative Transcriptional regulatory protein, AraC/XylS family [Bradyrhizobium sp. ORS 375]|uniref:helix-turn-helix domain-containing protein n=1 Tax=Bradyrhizobium sp. (strain ORS 375) TaxID=566679 RepID=UPI0002409127|nr:helix-turn-helix domain-containing protein [Bradyrhizobium sp. ORS 375]CCD96562.1 putative Transcriptional regulatory protein, AraC/XylS family [Bradyrhizobium sp. ORS 375]